MINNLPKCIITSFLTFCFSNLLAEDDIPILLRVSGNQTQKVAPGDTINIYVTATSSIKGSLSLEIKPEMPPFATNWDAKSVFCKSECSLADTLTLAPMSEDCGKYSFTINAQVPGSDDFSEVEHTINIEVAPKITGEPPFTHGISNLICWDGCDDLKEELIFFPASIMKSDGSNFLKSAASDHVRCEVIEGLTEGIKYGFYVKSTVLRDGEFMSLRSDTTFSTQDNTPPPAVSLHDFAVGPTGDVELRWRYLPDEIGYVEQYVLHRRNIKESAFAVVDSIPFFPAKVISPQNYFPVAAERKGILYLDRDEVITQLPDAIKGSTMIRTAAADRWRESETFLKFRLESPAEIFVAVDRRGEGILKWLKRDYRTINKDILTDAGTKLRIFKSRRVFPAGEVVLGGNFAAGVDIVHREPFMYAVFVQPAERVFPYQQGDFITYTDTLGEENDLETFNYQIQAIDAAGNMNGAITSSPVILDLHGHCKPIITDWFVAEGTTGQEFSRGTANRICIQDPNTLSQCVGFRDSDSLRFQAARGNPELLGTQPSGHEEGFFFDSGWIDVRDLPEAFCYDFELLPPGKDANFVNGQKYFYRVRAKDVHGNFSVWSDTVSAIQDFFPPTDISGLTGTTEVFASGDDGCVRLDWRPAIDQISGVGSYVIYRSDDAGATFSAIIEIDGAQTTYCDTLSQIMRNAIFSYKILAKDRVGNSLSLEETSQQVSLRALVAPRIEPDIDEIFDCPSGLIGVNRDTVAIKWQDFDATDVLRYEATITNLAGIQISKFIENPSATRAECPIDGDDGVYEIRLRVFYNNGDVTVFSNAVVVRKKTRLQGVESLIAEQTSGSAGDIALSWSHPDPDEIVEFQVFVWPEGAAQPEEPFVILPSDSLQWIHSFERDAIATYQCNNYLVRVRDCFDLISMENPIVSQYSNRAPTFDRTQIEIAGNNITVCWQRPSPRVKDDDSFIAQILVYQDSVTAVPFLTGEVFNNTCFTFFDAPPMHNYIFRVKETILDDLGQACSDSFVSNLSDPIIVPLDNLPPSVSLDAQALPVLPEETVGKVFLSWQEYESDVVDDFVVQWTGLGDPSPEDSLRVTGVDTVLITGLDLSRTYEFTVIATDFLGQRSVNNDIETVSFNPLWVFTPRPRRLNPSCFRDSVTVEWEWVDEDLDPVTGRLGSDSVFVELSIDSTFRFIKTSKQVREGNSVIFRREQDYPFVTRQNDEVYARVRAKDRFDHFSP
ncbi:fibronectin type III domain-containing protein, partial [bacterium]|nr:fibronectin type III domain-containing protein [bacterium]